MILDVSHIKNSFVVYSSCDKNELWSNARRYNIAAPECIIYDYDTSIISEAVDIVPDYENYPVPVLNILMEYANNFYVSTFFLHHQFYGEGNSI